MQLSILVPMLVVWLRRRDFPPAVKILSWYVYLSAFCVLGIRFFAPYDNSLYLIYFNVGKIALFATVYYKAVESVRMRQLVLITALAALAVCVGLTASGFFTHSFDLAVVVCRVVQSAVLAAFALVYLEQMLGHGTTAPVSRDPIWLLSVGQLLYSAGTVTAFSLDYLSRTPYEQAPKSMIVAVVGTIFNVFLTLAFLRAKPLPAVAADAETPSASQLARA
ncbi:hypothetical protein GCM10022407_07770 [Hymenobacter antarcticus]|uniref:YhhN-like protein n=2 Tax=Hymenobacter antarcticus TaxID=486270 RepID=A0ABP7PDQ0_9BACT